MIYTKILKRVIFNFILIFSGISLDCQIILAQTYYPMNHKSPNNIITDNTAKSGAITNSITLDNFGKPTAINGIPTTFIKIMNDEVVKEHIDGSDCNIYFYPKVTHNGKYYTVQVYKKNGVHKIKTSFSIPSPVTTYKTKDSGIIHNGDIYEGYTFDDITEYDPIVKIDFDANNVPIAVNGKSYNFQLLEMFSYFSNYSKSYIALDYTKNTTNGNGNYTLNIYYTDATFSIIENICSTIAFDQDKDIYMGADGKNNGRTKEDKENTQIIISLDKNKVPISINIYAEEKPPTFSSKLKIKSKSIGHEDGVPYQLYTVIDEESKIYDIKIYYRDSTFMTPETFKIIHNQLSNKNSKP